METLGCFGESRTALMKEGLALLWKCERTSSLRFEQRQWS